MSSKRKRGADPEVSRRSKRLQILRDRQAAGKNTEVTSQAAALAKPKRFRRPQQRKSCALFHKLPGEIRNKIYRFVLIEPKAIKVTSKGPGEPSLLRVCNRIRRETRGIYYTENEFELKMRDYDGVAFVPFKLQYLSWTNWKLGEIRGTNLKMTLVGRMNWHNLLAWVKSDRYSMFFWPEFPENCCPDHQMVSSVFRVVKATRGLPWDRVEEALEAMRDALLGLAFPWTD